MDIKYILQVIDEDADESIYYFMSHSLEEVESRLGIAERLVKEYKAETIEEKAEQKRDSEREEQLNHKDLELEQRAELENNLGCDTNEMRKI